MPERGLGSTLRRADLPALDFALDVQRMRDALAEATGVKRAELDRFPCTAEVLSLKPGQRCTIRYELSGARPRDGSVSVIGKVYRRRRLAARVHGFTDTLAAEVFATEGALRVPSALVLLPDEGISLLQFVEGLDLRYPLLEGTAETPLSLAARWLAALHMARPIAGLKIHSLEHELAKIDVACAEVAPMLAAPARRRLERTRTALHRVAEQCAPYRPAMIHRDFYYAHVLWDGNGIAVIDFDSLSIGDPALDVGHFLAHLETLAYRRTGNAASFANDGALFLDAYLAENGADVSSRLHFFKAYTFLKLAGIEVGRKRSAWEPQTTMLAEFASHAANLVR